MDPQEMATALALIKQRKFGLPFWSYIAVGAIALIAGAAGAFFGAKAENHAMKQDLKELTGITEQVRATIADASWQSQRFWEEKKLVYIQIVKGLDQLNLAYMDCERNVGALLMSDKTPPHIQAILDRAKAAAFEFRQAAAVSAIFLSPTAQKEVESFSGDSKKLMATGISSFKAADWCHEQRVAARNARTAVINAARDDLGATIGPAPAAK